MHVADGLELLPGDDGQRPVAVRWAIEAETPEAVAVDGDTLYVAGFSLVAYDLADGSLRWECDDDEGMEAIGGVVIGTDGPDVIRVFAPWEFDVRADRRDGHLLSRTSAGGGHPTSPASMPRTRRRSEWWPTWRKRRRTGPTGVWPGGWPSPVQHSTPPKRSRPTAPSSV